MLKSTPRITGFAGSFVFSAANVEFVRSGAAGAVESEVGPGRCGADVELGGRVGRGAGRVIPEAGVGLCTNTGRCRAGVGVGVVACAFDGAAIADRMVMEKIKCFI